MQSFVGAELPPKSPGPVTMPANLSHLLPPPASESSWIDDFLDFSSTRRGSHRRSVSDSTFLECLEIDDNGGRDKEFDILDDEQISSLFINEPATPSTNLVAVPASTSPSEQNSEQQNIEEDNRSSCKTEPQEQDQSQPTSGPDSMVIDPKRVKRIIANRQSAQRSRVRKLHYISELEHSVTMLQTEVSALSPQVAFLDHQRSILTVGNSHLRQRIAALAQDKIFKDAHQDALKDEIERLRQVYHQQNNKNMAASLSEPAVEALLS